MSASIVAPAEAGAVGVIGTSADTGPGVRRGDAVWRRPLIALALTIAAILLLFARDLADMTRLWWSISTYQHCLYIVPIAGWLVWLRRSELRDVLPAGWIPGLALVAGAALLWLLGQAGGVALVRHFALVAMVQACVVAILGPAATRAMLFPVFYLIFLVPFGDELTPAMQTLTAKLAMGLLHLTGVQATMDGVFITTRMAWFEVAEACAGVKFLVAMLAYGALAAHVCFRSPLRRAIFIVAAVVVPVLANGVRAWATIYAAEIVGVEAATGFDHIVYGWIFFALVMIAIMGAAWPFFDRKLSEPWLGGRHFSPWKPVAPVLLMAPLAIGIAVAAPVWDALAAARGHVTLPARVDLPTVPGWARVSDAPVTPWRPRFDGADHLLFGRYGDVAGQRVDVGVALYGWQGKGREIVAYGQGAADPDGPWRWTVDLPSHDSAKVERLLGPGKAVRQTATFWYVSGVRQTGRMAVKLATLHARLTGSDQSAAVLIVSAEGAGADEATAAFLKAMAPTDARIMAMLRQAKGR
ncbi:MAG: exosortase A [Sphingomonadales bacterium]